MVANKLVRRTSASQSEGSQRGENVADCEEDRLAATDCDRERELPGEQKSRHWVSVVLPVSGSQSLTWSQCGAVCLSGNSRAASLKSSHSPPRQLLCFWLSALLTSSALSPSARVTSGGCHDEQLQGAPSLRGPGGRLLLAAAHGARCYLLCLHRRLWPGEQILADDRAEAKVLTCGGPEWPNYK